MSMIRQIAPQFFTIDIPGTLAYYKNKLGFECLGTWHDPPVYAIVARDQHAIHFRALSRPQPIRKNMRTNCWTHTSVSKMQMRFMPSMQPTAWSSLGDLPTRHGTHGSS
jgi:hypothetical protein